jgi:hypothetical protein
LLLLGRRTSPKRSSVADAGLRSTGTTLTDLEVKQRLAATPKAAAKPSARPERLGFTERMKLFQGKGDKP